MTWWTLADGFGVLELDGTPGLELELAVFWRDGRTRCAWLFSQTGQIAWWAEVGAA